MKYTTDSIMNGIPIVASAFPLLGSRDTASPTQRKRPMASTALQHAM
jgi:hypothetical protein